MSVSLSPSHSLSLPVNILASTISSSLRATPPQTLSCHRPRVNPWRRLYINIFFTSTDPVFPNPSSRDRDHVRGLLLLPVHQA